MSNRINKNTSKHNVTTSSYYRGYTINTGEDNDLPCNTTTLNQVIDSIEHMTSHHSKVLATRLDIHSEKDSDRPLTGYDMTRITESVKRNLDSKFKGSKNQPDTKVIWTTEQTRAESNPHYHVFALVNGNAIHNGRCLMSTFNKYVQKKLDTDNEGLVHFSSSNKTYGTMIERSSENFEQQKNDAVYAGSYLSKTRSKEHNPKGSRVSSSSRLNKDQKK